MIVKPATSFVRTDTDAQLLTDTKTILTLMKDNAAYPEPSPTLPTVATAADDFSTALANAANGGTERTALKNASRAALAILLRALAAYVAVACKRDLARLLSSGFPIQKPVPTPAGVLPAPAIPVLSRGARSGTLAAATRPLAAAYSYNWRLALASDPTAYVQLPQTTAASLLFAGLTPGQIYLVDVSAFGTAGTSDWSGTAQLTVT